MKKIGPQIAYAVEEMARGSESARLNLRIQEVRARYRQVIETVYRGSAPLHLAHTNSVIITTKNGVKTLIVYVDDSLFAAELNAQRELIRLKLLELFGENIEDFQILTSKRRKYREMHPFLDENDEKANENSPVVPLSVDETSYIDNVSSLVSDEKVRKSLKKAMTADLQWKKGEKIEKRPNK